MTTLQISRRFAFAPAPASKRGTASKLSGWKAACTIFLFCATMAIVAPAQTFMPPGATGGRIFVHTPGGGILSAYGSHVTP